MLSTPEANSASSKPGQTEENPPLRRRITYFAVFGAAILLVTVATVAFVYNDIISRLNSAQGGSAKAAAEGVSVATLVKLEETRTFPMGLAASTEIDGPLYVSLFGKGGIRKLSGDGTLTPWATGLTAPGAMAFSPDGMLYVIDYNAVDFRVAGSLKRISPDGRAGNFGNLTDLPLLAGLTVDKNGVVYASHPDTAQIWRITPDGRASPWWTLAAQGGTAAQPVGMGYDADTHALLVADAVHGTIYRFDLNTDTPEGIALVRNPGLDVRALALDDQGRVLVANWKHENGQLQRLESDGKLTLLAENFNAPTAIVYRAGKVYVVNSGVPGLIEQISERLPYTVEVVTLP